MKRTRALTWVLVSGAAASVAAAVLEGPDPGGQAGHRPAAPVADAARLVDGEAHWEALLATGDATRRAEATAGSRAVAEARARTVYRAALALARQQQSLDGVLRVTEALAAVGDREGVKLGLRVATTLAGGDREAQADIEATTLGLAASAC